MAIRANQGSGTQPQPTAADFRAAGLPFEAFLRLAQLPEDRNQEAVRVFWAIYGDRAGRGADGRGSR